MRFRCAGSDCDWGDEASAVAALKALAAGATHQRRRAEQARRAPPTPTTSGDPLTQESTPRWIHISGSSELSVGGGI